MTTNLLSGFSRRSSRFVFILGIVGALAAANSGCSREAKIASHLTKADRYFTAGEYDKAEIEYASVLQLDANDPRAIAQLGVIFFDEGRNGLAAAFLPKARGIAPDNLDARVRLAMMNLGTGRLDDARAEAWYVMRHRPDDEDAPFVLADTVREAKDVADIRAQVQQLPSPQGLSRLIALGFLDARDRKFDQAEAELTTAQKLYPKSGAPSFALGQFYTAQKDLKRADQAYVAAIALSSPWSPRRIRYAQFLLQIGKVDEAKRTLTELTKTTPNYLPAWMMLASIAANEKKPNDALGYLSKVLGRDPLNHDALLAQARATFENGDKATAVTLLERMVKTFPKSPEPRLQLAMDRWSMGDADKAANDLNQLLAVAPNLPGAILLLAEIDVRRGQAAKAVKALNELVKKQPTFGPARLLLAQAYRADGKLDEAIAIYRQIDASAPGNPQPSYLLGMVLLQQRKTAEARQAFEKALKIAPGFLPPFEQLINTDLIEKNVPAAKGRIRARIVSNPNSAELQLLLARVHMFAGETAEGEVALQRVIELQPDSPVGYYLLGEHYLRTRQTDKALPKLQQSLAKNPKNVQALALVAAIYDQQANYAEARKCYEQVLALNPKSIVALNNLAFLDSEKFNDVEHAFNLAQQARELAPHDPNIGDTLGWIAFKKRMYPWALTLLTECAEQLPSSAEIQYHLGMTHYMLGHRDDAHATLERAIALKPDFAGAADARQALTILAIDPKAEATTSRQTLEKQLANHPDDVMALTLLGSVYERLSDTNAAKRTYEAAYKANPSNTPAALGLIRVHMARQETTAALELARTAHQANPDDAETTHLLGQLALATGNYPWAFSLLQESARHAPSDPETQLDLAEAAYSTGRIAEAQAALHNALAVAPPFSRATRAREFLAMIELAADPNLATTSADRIEKALKENPDDIAALAARAALQERRLEFAAAAASYEKVLGKCAGFTPAQRRLAILGVKAEGSPAKLLPIAVKAREAFPDDTELARAYGILLYRNSEFGRAVLLLQESARKTTPDAELMYYLGAAQAKLKNRNDSEQSLRRALELGLSGNEAADARKILERRS